MSSRMTYGCLGAVAERATWLWAQVWSLLEEF